MGFYDWGNKNVNMMVLQPSDSIVNSLATGATNLTKGGIGAPSDNMDQYMGRKNKKSTFIEDPLPGYHPDDLIDYAWMDNFNDKEEEDDGKEKGKELEEKRDQRKPSRI